MNINQIHSNITKLPPPHNHDKWVEVFNEMIVHTRGAPAGDILTKRRPNEDPEVQKYRQDVDERITKGSINRAIDKLFRIFMSANWSVEISDGLSKYLDVEKFKNQHFYSYIQKFVVRRMIEDPNGFLVWVPWGEGLQDPTQAVRVKPVLVESSAVKFYDHETLVWLDPKLKSTISVGGVNKDEGDIFWVMDLGGFYQITQVGTSAVKEFRLDVVYPFGENGEKWPDLPLIQLGGDMTDDDYLASYFSAFLPFANEAIRQYSDWVGVMTTAGFPYREEQSEDCKSTGCRGGWKLNPTTGEADIKCKKCNGTGKIIVRSPYGVYMREKGGSVLNPTTNNDPMLRFISPDVQIIKESRLAWEILLERAERALCLDMVDHPQSGEAKKIDREDSFMVFTKVSNNVFDEIIFRSLRYIERYRNIQNPVDPIITKPISFVSKTEDDLIDELNKLTDKNAPVAFMVECTKDLAKKRFSGNKAISRMVEILVTYDPIYHVSQKDKQMMVSTGIITKADVLRSLYAFRVLNTMVATKGPKYLETDLSQIFTDLDAAIQPFIEEKEKAEAIPLPLPVN